MITVTTRDLHGEAHRGDAGAIKTVRLAFDAFYAALSDGQKARLDSVGPRRWGWHWRWNG